MPTFPLTNFSNMTMRSVNPTRVTTAINGIEQRSAIGSQYYTFVANFNNLNQADQRKLMAFIDEMRGPLTTFDLALPSYLGNSTGAFTGAITTAAGSSLGATTVTITSAAANGVTVLKAGDLIRFASHTKVYTVKTDVVAAAGNETVTLSQPLRAAVLTSTTVTHQSVSASVRFSQEIGEFSVGQDLYANFSIEFNEVLT